MYIGRVNCLRSNKSISPLRMKRPLVKMNWLKHGFSNMLFKTSVIIMDWGTSIQKRKYPQYWVGGNRRLFRYSTWLAVLSHMLARQLNVNISASCYLSIIDGMVTIGKDDSFKNHNLFYQRLCLQGADIFGREAKLRGEKTLLIKNKVKRVLLNQMVWTGPNDEDVMSMVRSMFQHKKNAPLMIKIEGEINNADTNAK